MGPPWPGRLGDVPGVAVSALCRTGLCLAPSGRGVPFCCGRYVVGPCLGVTRVGGALYTLLSSWVGAGVSSSAPTCWSSLRLSDRRVRGGFTDGASDGVGHPGVGGGSDAGC